MSTKFTLSKDFKRSRFSPMRSRTRGRKQVLDEHEMEEISEAFNLFDSNGTGSIDAKELKAAFRALGFNVKSVEIRRMMQDLKKGETGKFTLDDFISVVTPKMASRDTKEEILKIFDLFDDDNSGNITFRKLKRVASELGENLSDDELTEMIEEADRNNDGAIDREEFFRVMKKRGDNPLDDLDSDSD